MFKINWTSIPRAYCAINIFGSHIPSRLLLAGLGKGGNSYFETDYLCFSLARPRFHTTLPFWTL